MDKKSLALLGIVTMLFGLGLVMIFNTTSAEVIDRALNVSVYQAVIKQLLYAIFGIGCALCLSKIGYAKIMRMSAPLLLFATGLLVLVLIPGVGVQINGARRWISFLGISLQPSEFVKYLIPIYVIHEITAHKKTVDFVFFLRLIGKLCIPLGLILMEPDNGSVLILGVTLVFLCILMRIRPLFWLVPLSVIACGGAVAALRMPHVIDRLQVFIHPERDLLGKGHQPYQAKIATGSGGLYGRGLGESLQKMNYLPEARSDYIAAIFAEECGFIGIVLLIAFYMTIGVLGYAMAISVRHDEAFYLLATATFLLCFQAFFNLGVVSGMLPSKGMNLPFFSQGGSSLVAQLLIVSMMISAYRARLLHERS